MRQLALLLQHLQAHWRRLFPGGLRAWLRNVTLEEYYQLALRMKRTRWPFLLTRLTGWQPLRAKQAAFFTALFSLLAKLAEADGAVRKAEIAAVEEFMAVELNLTPQQKVLALQIFRRAKTASTSFEKYAEQYYAQFRKDREMLENLIDVLVAVALADRQFTYHEERLIKAALSIFRLSRHDYERIRARHGARSALRARLSAVQRNRAQSAAQQVDDATAGGDGSAGPRTSSSEAASELDAAYNLIGAKRGDSLAAIKRRYRKLALTFHPDRLLANGQPEELKAFSEKRFREIQEAYELLEQHLSKKLR